MLNRSDAKLNRAEAAEAAQLLRGDAVFGAVAYSEKALLCDEAVAFAPGYDACLPLVAGGCWRDPARPIAMETIS